MKVKERKGEQSKAKERKEMESTIKPRKKRRYARSRTGQVRSDLDTIVQSNSNITCNRIPITSLI